jgi:cytochrome bd-type quinol oxidase subunit 2
MKRIKQLMTSFLLTFSFVVPAVVPATVFAQADLTDGLCQGIELQVGEGVECQTAGATNTINQTIVEVIDIFTLIVGIAAVIMIIIGGLKYITSGGDSGNVTGAKNTILYAVIGLVVVALAQVIVRFVLGLSGQV